MALRFPLCQAAALLLTVFVSSAYDVSMGAEVDGSTRYILGSFPALMQVNYIKLPDPVWRPLVTTGLVSPSVLTIDSQLVRLYVVDEPVGKVYMYQLTVLPDGTLICDGTQHIAVNAVIAKGVSLDAVGSMYIAGHRVVPPPLPSTFAIFKQDTIALLSGFTSGIPADPIEIWNPTSTPTKLQSPSGVAVDSFNMFWSNGASGSSEGSIIKGPHSPPAIDPAVSVTPIADNLDSVTSIALTPTAVFYTGGGKIYGIPKRKSSSECGADSADCPQVTDTIRDPNSMIWDGDGTMYLSDASSAVYSFPSGTVGVHETTLINEAPGISKIALLQYSPNSGAWGRSVTTLLLVIVALSVVQ